MSKEVHFDESQILLSTTDLNSRITYVNASFSKVAGYTVEELNGNPHNIVRHPDMPKKAFSNMWKTIQAGESWMGPVKNRCKNGDFYWVNAYVTPIKNSFGRIVEFQSVRTKPNRNVVDRANKIYQKLDTTDASQNIARPTDITLWVSNLLLLILISSLFSLLTEEFSNIILSSSIALTTTTLIIFHIWRKKYVNLVERAKQVYDNHLMNYIYTGSNDSLSTLVVAMDKKDAELKAVIGRIKDDAVMINHTASSSIEKNEQVANVINDQNIEINNISETIINMSSAINDIAETMNEASEIAVKGREISNSGQIVVSDTTISMNSLSTQLGVVSNAINELVSGTKSIEKVLEVINGIAEQTNLLALNAAIESARAGEHGKGFAVVAEEVRALAIRTQDSTKHVNTILQQLQTESSSAILAMEHGHELSDACVNQVQKTGQSLSEINTKISKLAKINSNVASAINEQLKSASGINKNIRSISDMSANSECQSHDSIALGKNLLDRLVEQLSLVEQFSLSSK